MKQTSIIFIITFLVATTLNYKFARAQSESKTDLLTISLSTGYQHENFNWSIAGNAQGQNPNIYSELKWTNLKAPVMQLGVSVKPWKHLLIKSNMGYGFIKSGSVNDRDYLGDDRTRNVYDGTFNSNEGYTSSAELIVGYQLMPKKRFSIMPQVGYVVYEQKLFLLGSDPNTSEKLRSTYKTIWNGGYLGTDFQYTDGKKIIVEHAFYYNQLHYKSEADWNLIPSFKHPISFTQRANAYKVATQYKVSYRISGKMKIFIYGRYEYWKTGKGIDRLYLNNGTVSDTRFNGANRKGIMIGAGVSWSVFKP